MPRVLLLFADGVGIGDDRVEWNPFLSASLPSLRSLLNGRPVTGTTTPYRGEDASLVGIDAGLGVDGTPQSGTGQAALLTGANAALMHGGHFGPWVPSRLQRMVREESLLFTATAAGFRTAFANAYPEEILELVSQSATALAGDESPASDGSLELPAGEAESTTSQSLAAVPADRAARRLRRGPSFLRAGPPLAALGAGLLTRHTAELERGDAVASEITNDGWRTSLGRLQLPVIDARTAGHNLARITADHDLTLFAHYATDYAGHRRDMAAAVTSLERLDAFIGGILEAMLSDTVLFVVSDHGNIEDVRTGHTRNPALGLVVGEGHAGLASRLRSLTDIAPAIMDLLSFERSVEAAAKGD
ncbi:metalloenzyme [soil metagenome]